jgi:hypothetical protein
MVILNNSVFRYVPDKKFYKKFRPAQDTTLVCDEAFLPPEQMNVDEFIPAAPVSARKFKKPLFTYTEEKKQVLSTKNKKKMKKSTSDQEVTTFAPAEPTLSLATAPRLPDLPALPWENNNSDGNNNIFRPQSP